MKNVLCLFAISFLSVSAYAQPSNYYLNTEFKGWSGNTMTNDAPVSGAVQYTVLATSANDELVVDWNSGADKWQQGGSFPIGSISTLYHCTSGCPNTVLSSNTTSGYHYTLNIKERAYANVSAIIHETSAAPVDFAGVSPITVSPSTVYIGQDVEVTVNLAASKSSEEKCYVRYYDGASDGVVEVAFVGSSGTATIPGSFHTSGRTVNYYAFTTTLTTAPVSRNDDGWSCLRFQSGSSYTVKTSYTNIASGTSNCDGSWDDTDCWVGGALPGNTLSVELSQDMSIDASATAYIGDLTIPSGVNLTFGSSSVLDINNSRLGSPTSSSVLLLDGTVSTDKGTVHFSDGGNLTKTSGTIELYEMTTNYNGGGSTVEVNNDLKIYGGISTNWSSAIDLNSNDLEMAGGNMTFGANPAFFSNLGLVSFTGTGSQEIVGYAVFPAGLTINKSSGDVLQQYWFQGSTRRGVSVTGGALTLTNGNLDGSGVISGWSGSTNIGSSASISGSSTGYVKGGLTMNVSSSSVTFPVGNSTYNPVVISNSGTADDFTISVEDYVTDDGTSGGTAVTSKAINRTWSITEATAGGSNASVTIQWGSADELTGFAAERTSNNVYVSHYTGGAWSPATAGAVTGSDPYTLTMTGLTSFSPFGIGGGGALPISLLEFKAEIKEDVTKLDWSTASEINSSHFNVYRSKNGIEKEWIGDKPANGNSSEVVEYSFLDQVPVSGKALYFLESVDYDGTSEWFGPVSVSEIQREEIASFYNKLNNRLELSIPNDLEGDKISVRLFTLNGQSVFEESIDNTGTGKSYVNIPSLNAGIYILQVTDMHRVYTKKLKL
ncbi:MAG: T9SS type A sorting domain-containing protein [Bacteroidia bacterium]